MAKEATLKTEVHKYLKELYELDLLYFDRLNSGMLMTSYGGKRLPVHLCREGTADYYFIKDGVTTYLELKIGYTKPERREKQAEFARRVTKHGALYFKIENMEQLRWLFE